MIYGLCCHSPEELVRFLLTFNKTPYYFVLPHGDLISNHRIPRKAKYIFILDHQDFARNYRLLVQMKREVFIFGGVSGLLEYTGVNFIDAVIDTSGTLKVDYLEDIDPELYRTACVSRTYKRKRRSYVDKLIQGVRAGSLLNAFMTFVYKLPAKTHQKPVKILASLYLTKGWSEKRLDSEIQKLGSKIRLTENVVSMLKALLSEPVAVRLQAAFKSLKSYEDIEEVAAANRVSAYEMRYMVKTLESDKAYSNNSKVSIDDYLEGKK